MYRFRVGQTFGKWKIIETGRLKNGGERASLCQCQCGTERIIINYRLAKGYSRSCGSCAQRSRPSNYRARRKRNKIAAFLTGAGRYVTLREIVASTGYPQPTVAYHLKALLADRTIVRPKTGWYAAPGVGPAPEIRPPMPPPTQAGRLAAIDAIPPAMAGRPA